MKVQRCYDKKYDVVVIGGGMSGINAAIAAARHGAKTAIIHARPVLGGNASSEIRMHIAGANCHLSKKDLTETGIIEELLLENKQRNPYQSFSIWDSVLWEKVRFQNNLDCYLNTSMDSVETCDNKIKSVICHQITTETTYNFSADIFIDATGNGTLGFFAGAEYQIGSDNINQTNASKNSNEYKIGSTLMFIAEDMGEPVKFKKPSWAYSFDKEELKFRSHDNNGVKEHDTDSGYWWIELEGFSRDIVGDHERINEDIYKYIYGIWDYIKNSGDYEAENYALTWVGTVPCGSESRRLVGDYILNKNDIYTNRIFNDAVAYGGWPIDEHPQTGIFRQGPPKPDINFPGAYTIPYRCYYSRNIENLMMVGRNISTTKVALSSTRVMGTCSVGGQAVGTAAALAVKYNCTPREVALYMDELQQTLLKDDCYIPGYINTASADLLMDASVSAKSFISGCEPDNVINGMTRTVGDKKNCWESNKISEKGETISVTVPSATAMRQLRLTFDSNLNQEIIPSMTNSVRKSQIKGMPIELVKNYEIRVYNGDELTYFKEVTNNYQRLNIHELPESTCGNRIDVTVLETHGYSNARIFEIRAY
ncbi:FAD-dependent oxidoreductase [Ruminiclostridium papyrosolvens]|uniref:FAD-dependent oxidoreductase n=1 Tax=Ruminiclostridium papyrosolvens C7 TaxID=1330534 RepID=U4R0S1_9FIRM|nr:FAD-dependent oxidoreductase [Ruminiclostridium papyrosolvens]EPR10353.1 FAD-dependent oxidoreductase [Ruminiclostridium papyrosolvens C7]